MNNKIEFINLERLHLDFQNPRLPESIKIKNFNEKDIINWMLENASIIELMLAIGEQDFFIGEALFVIKKDDSYIVVDGNRRLVSLKLLNDPSLSNLHKSKIQKVLVETTHRPNKIPCIIFSRREEIIPYLGYMHITGIKPWNVLEKARYLNNLTPALISKSFDLQVRELAKKIGTRSDYIRIQLIGFQIYRIIINNDFYNIPNLNEETFHFHYILNFLKHEHIRNFISVDLDSKNPLDKFNKNGKENLSTLINWLYRKNKQGRPRVYGFNEDLIALEVVLSSSKALEHFIDGRSLQEALKYTNGNAYH